MEARGRKVNGGKAEGEAIVYKGPFSFLGGMSPQTGRILIKNHEIEGKSLANKVFVFATGKGSSQVARVVYQAKQAGNAPSAIICLDVEPIIAAAVLVADIPTVDKLDKNPFNLINTGDFVEVDADQGIVKVRKKSRNT